MIYIGVTRRSLLVGWRPYNVRSIIDLAALDQQWSVLRRQPPPPLIDRSRVQEKKWKNDDVP